MIDHASRIVSPVRPTIIRQLVIELDRRNPASAGDVIAVESERYREISRGARRECVYIALHPNGDDGNVMASSLFNRDDAIGEGTTTTTTTTVERAVSAGGRKVAAPAIDTVIGNALWTKWLRRLRGIKRDVNALLQFRLGHATRRKPIATRSLRSPHFFSIEPSIREHGPRPRAAVTPKKSNEKRSTRRSRAISIRRRDTESEKKRERDREAARERENKRDTSFAASLYARDCT